MFKDEGRIEVVAEDEDEAVALEEESSEATPKKLNKKALGGIIAGLLVVCLIGGGIALATSQPAVEENVDEPAKTEVVKTKTIWGVAIFIPPVSDAEVIIPANVKITDSTGRNWGGLSEVEIGNAEDVIELPKGVYELTVTSAPIEIDGSTYVIPTDPFSFEIGVGENDHLVKVPLERLAVEDMTKEQLEAVASRVEEAGHTELAASLREKAESAASDPESVAAVAAPDAGSSNASNNGGGTSSGSTGSANNNNSGENNGSGNSSGNNSASSPSHSHSYVTPVYGDKPWILTQAAQPEVPEQGYWQAVWNVGGVDYYSVEEATAAQKATGWGVSTRSDWIVTVAYQPAIPEQGYWGEAPIIGYKCSCGAQQ